MKKVQELPQAQIFLIGEKPSHGDENKAALIEYKKELEKTLFSIEFRKRYNLYAKALS